MGSENTPPASPGIPVPEGGDEMYEDEIAEEINETDLGTEVIKAALNDLSKCNVFSVGGYCR